jgi:hypothetical protein
MFLGFVREFFETVGLMNSLRSCVRFVEGYIYVNLIFVFMFTLLSTNKGTLRQVFIRVNRLEIQLVMVVFLTQLCELLPL